VALFQCLVIGSIFRAYRRLGSQADIMRFHVYQMMVLGVVFIFVIEGNTHFANVSAVRFLLPLTVYNMFVLMMTYLHWPCSSLYEGDIVADL
jgi:hypothetical protein